MEVEFIVNSKMKVDHDMITNEVRLIDTQFNLLVDSKIDPRPYTDSDGKLNKDGHNLVTRVLVESLVANIHISHQSETIDSAEHLRHIIAELENGFIRVGKVITSKKNNDGSKQ